MSLLRDGPPRQGKGQQLARSHGPMCKHTCIHTRSVRAAPQGYCLADATRSSGRILRPVSLSSRRSGWRAFCFAGCSKRRNRNRAKEPTRRQNVKLAAF
ncbi:Hypothetical predicted protein [Podarcis lilfordi]|uniref:Uncharacterized protein n=1 Tax=Podarcis lilfordi TaxID=74358 RepID=A0AA35PAI3_9SAUR|nr:Hypothetical predicted protein [Podarcis lilfordi]